MEATALDALFDWLLDGAPGATPLDLIAHVGMALRSYGVPVDRLSAFVTTLHPNISGRAFQWSPGAPAEILDIPHGDFDTAPVLAELASAGYTDYVALPLVFTDGHTHAVTVATRAPQRFSDRDLAALRRVVRPLARVVEIFALRRTAANLLSTYVGRNAGDMILAGHIQKGDFETIRAVIWFSDLRGFTAMSSRSSPREVIDTLNRAFDCQVGSIQRRGGEVLEFMGDGMLAIFPFAFCADEAATEIEARRLCDLAIEAAEEVERAPELASGGAPPRLGVAIHVGELAYGNIGGANRLDFTAIGPAVNLAARLESVTSKLGRTLVVSEAVARLATRRTEHVGTFDLKGLPEPVKVFAPAAAASSARPSERRHPGCTVENRHPRGTP